MLYVWTRESDEKRALPALIPMETITYLRCERHKISRTGVRDESDSDGFRDVHALG